MLQLPKWNFTNIIPAFSDLESGTAIEMTAKVYGAMRDLIDEYNKFAEDLNKQIAEFEAETEEDIAEQNKVILDAVNFMKANLLESLSIIAKEMKDSGALNDELRLLYIDILNEINQMSARMDTFTSLEDGSTTGDAELIDLRIEVDGTVHETAGEAVRKQFETKTKQINNLDVFKRVNLVRDIVKGKYLAGNGTIYEDERMSHTTPIYLASGSVVYSSHDVLYGTNRNCFRIENDVYTPVSPVLTEDAYSKYEITESGYYVFNTTANGGAVCYSVNDLSYFNRGVYLPDDIIGEKIEGFHRINLVSKCENGFLNTCKINSNETNKYCHSNPIFLKAGETVYTPYIKTYGVNTHLWMIQPDGTPLYQKAEKVNTDSTEYNEYHITASGYYSVNGVNGYACLVKNLEDLNKHMGCYIPEDCLSFSSVLDGKSISFNGDSICAGAGHSGGYGKIIADVHNMTYENIAVGGATITAEQYRSDNGNARHWISRTIENMNPEADYFIVEGGVNDASLKVPLGTLTNDFTSNLDDTTFYGAFEKMCKMLVSLFPGKKVGYIFTHKTISGYNSLYAGNYYTAAKECCEKWGVPYIDLNVLCPPLNYVQKLKEAYTYEADGWHPNEQGYKLYYVPKITAWLESL